MSEPTVLHGASRSKPLPVLRRGEKSEVHGLQSDLGKAWEIGEPTCRAEEEMQQISRANGEIYRGKIEARNAAYHATTKRYREECETAVPKDPCLSTLSGPKVVLQESREQTREAQRCAEEAIDCANQLKKQKNALEMMMAQAHARKPSQPGTA